MHNYNECSRANVEIEQIIKYKSRTWAANYKIRNKSLCLFVFDLTLTSLTAWHGIILASNKPYWVMAGTPFTFDSNLLYTLLVRIMPPSRSALLCTFFLDFPNNTRELPASLICIHYSSFPCSFPLCLYRSCTSASPCYSEKISFPQLLSLYNLCALLNFIQFHSYLFSTSYKMW